MRTNLGRAALVIGLVATVAAGLRLAGLGTPSRKVFDEVYYASDGCRYAGYDYRACGLDVDSERSWVHPPLGKILVGWGIDLFGNRPFGWRFSSVVAGTATVALTGAIAFLLTGGWLWAGVGALLAATEPLLFVQSRVAMLDVFLTLFIVLGFFLLLLDRRRNLERGPPPAVDAPPASAGAPDTGDTWLDAPPEAQGPWVEGAAPVAARTRSGWVRPIRLLGGAALGAAVAVKWSGGAALVGALLLALAWERTHAKRWGATYPLGRAVARQWGGLLLAFAVVPAAVYLASWTPWFAERGTVDLNEWAGHHADMADYHLSLSTENEEGDPIHPYMSRAWTWPLLIRPVAYYFESERWGRPGARAREILAIGSPLLFWGGLLVTPYLLLAWWRRRRWEAGAVAVPILIQHLPWLLVSRPLFLFYMTPVAPFLALGATLVVRDLTGVRFAGRRALAPLAAALVVTAVGLFAFFWPILTGASIHATAWQARMWLGSWV